MNTSKKMLNKTIRHQLESIYYQLIVDTTTTSQAKKIFTNLLTDSELLTIIQRLAVAIYLEKGRSHDNIKSNLKVNSATISRIQEKMGDPGIQLALQKIKAEAWADNWVNKIGALMKRLSLTK